MPKGKLSPDGEVFAAQGSAVVAAFQVLINCLEESDALLPGQFPAALGGLHGDDQEQDGRRARYDACGAT